MSWISVPPTLRMIWFIFNKSYEDQRTFWYIKPELPCKRGEIGFNILGLSVILGWRLTNG